MPSSPYAQSIEPPSTGYNCSMIEPWGNRYRPRSARPCARRCCARLSVVRHLRGTPAPRIEVDWHNCVDVLVNACGSDRRRVGVAGAALVGHEGTNLVDDSHILRLRSRRRPSIGLVAHKTARTAAAAPLEGEVAVVVYAEVVKC